MHLLRLALRVLELCASLHGFCALIPLDELWRRVLGLVRPRDLYRRRVENCRLHVAGLRRIRGSGSGGGSACVTWLAYGYA